MACKQLSKEVTTPPYTLFYRDENETKSVSVSDVLYKGPMTGSKSISYDTEPPELELLTRRVQTTVRELHPTVIPTMAIITEDNEPLGEILHVYDVDLMRNVALLWTKVEKET